MSDTPPAETPAQPPKIRRLHQDVVGYSRIEYDGYQDVGEACQRWLEKRGLWTSGMGNNDWLFTGPRRPRTDDTDNDNDSDGDC